MLGPLCVFASADKIFLKGGQVIEGNILTSNGSQYYIAVDGIKEPVRFDLADIDHMELNGNKKIISDAKISIMASKGLSSDKSSVK